MDSNKPGFISRHKLKARLKKDGVPYCPKCLSTLIKTDKPITGTGVVVMGPASVGHMPATQSYITGSGSAPLPPIDVSRENIVAGQIHAECNACGAQFWIKQK